jgi:hypothetical protein
MASAQSSSKVKGPPSEEEMAADLCSKIGETGVDVEGLNLEEELTDAITTAVAKAQESGDTTDMRKVIEQAIDDTLKENGLDPEAIKEQLRPAGGPGGPQGGGGMPPGPPPDGMGGVGDSSSSSSSDEDDDDTSTSQLDLLTSELLSQLWNTDSESSVTLSGLLLDMEA